MAQQPIQKYYGLRIYLSSSLLYFFLVFPFMIYLGLQNLPNVAGDRGLFRNDSISLEDSILQIDSIVEGKGVVVVAESGSGEINHPDLIKQQGPFARYFKWLFFLTLIVYLIGYIYNHPFKRFFKRKNRKQEIPERLHTYCKNQLQHTPLVNGFIIILPNVLLIVYSLVFLMSQKKCGCWSRKRPVHSILLPHPGSQPSGIYVCLLLAKTPGPSEVH